MTELASWVAHALRGAREQRGWSQSELARRLNRTQTAISYWEAGKRTPRLDDLLDIADALEIEVDAFLPPQRARRPATAILRATAERLADADLRTEIDALIDDAELSELPRRDLVVTSRAPAYAANELLERAGVRSAPVPIEGLAARCGVLVRYRTFPDSLSGLVFAHDDGAVIGVNAAHHANRQRFSLAHELGHYLLGHTEASSTNDDRFHIDVAEGTPPGYDWRAERAANEFAADVLMPRRIVMAAFSRHPNPVALALEFSVSEIAMGYRLVNLGLR
jgi:transcriptional regulator with XRE-family HTH domain